jgi:hypothetical protein
MPTTYAIIKGNQYMDATLYTGTGNVAATQVNTAGFKPDMVWMKSRSNGYDHILYDSVRGTGTSKSLGPNITGAEGADADYANLTSFNSNGFSTGVTSNTNTLNNSGSTFVAWQWQAGQGANVTNTSGTITSTVSANTTAGFSIVTYTGAFLASTVGHGLGVTPKFIIVKSRSDAFDWNCWVTGFAGNEYLVLNSTTTKLTSTTLWNNTTPTSSVFSVGLDNGSNKLSSSFVAYCWAEIAGFSKFGSYTGNGSTDGPFIYLGFRPKFWMAKRTDVGAPWLIYDSSRNTYNVVNNYLQPSAADAEGSGSSPNDVNDFLSNGFKVRCSNLGENANGGTYIYAAWAETPFKYANAR